MEREIAELPLRRTNYRPARCGNWRRIGGRGTRRLIADTTAAFAWGVDPACDAAVSSQACPSAPLGVLADETRRPRALH
ncbi:MAG: hypothetical protein GPOALKHO_000373 [Sodalis sp.]|nr:MAG: hypothetical protein GPOALKHO_000373 [Sodalis sp.]